MAGCRPLRPEQLLQSALFAGERPRIQQGIPEPSEAIAALKGARPPFPYLGFRYLQPSRASSMAVLRARVRSRVSAPSTMSASAASTSPR